MKRKSYSGHIVIGIIIVVFVLMAAEIIPRDWMVSVLLLLVLLVLVRTTVKLVLDRQERLRQESKEGPS